ncbi:hypothetical protein SAMN03097699_3054 [Flavobacteriaceae bacterium MAR_2010_188]|nr:hypothetical protein SAMN03097699_3054 [Flavobacteriaceae bacterium MAR_2010_188]
MKTLKITFLLVAVVLLAMSGVSSDSFKKDNNVKIDTNNVELNLLTHERSAKTSVPTNS